MSDPMHVAQDESSAIVVEGVDLWFGGTPALSNVSFTTEPGQVFGIMGPNGAGKSSILNVFNGFYRPRSGSVRFAGHELVGMPPHRIAGSVSAERSRPSSSRSTAPCSTTCSWDAMSTTA